MNINRIAYVLTVKKEKSNVHQLLNRKRNSKPHQKFLSAVDMNHETANPSKHAPKPDLSTQKWFSSPVQIHRADQWLTEAAGERKQGGTANGEILLDR